MLSQKTVALTATYVSLIVLGSLTPAAWAQNAAFQTFFFDVCAANPTGALGARCAETVDAAGNLSGDSESSLNPGQFLAVNQSALARTRVTGKEVQGHLEEKRTERSKPAGAGQGTSVDVPRWGVYTHGAFESLERAATVLERGSEADSMGVQLGFDYRVSDRAFIGLLLSSDSTDSEFDPDEPGVNFTPPPNDGDGAVDSASLTFYASRYLTDKVWLDGSVGYGVSDYEFVRNAVFQESGRMVPQTNVTASAETDGTEVTAGAGLGYDTQKGGYSGGLYGRLSFARTEVDGFTETDLSGLQMGVDDETGRSLVATLGWQGSFAASTSWGVVLPQFRVEYEHEFENDVETVTTRYLLDPSRTTFQLTGEAPDEDFINVAAGLVIVAPRGWSLFFDYEVLAEHRLQDRGRLTVGLRKEL